MIKSLGNCVVTGASSGIGRAIAIEFARYGAARILVHYHRNRSGAEQTANQIQDLGGEAFLVSADIGDPRGRQDLVNKAWTELSSIDAWVNNAGVDVLTGTLAKADFEQKLQRLWEVDVLGTIALSRVVGAQLQKQTSGEHRPSMLFIGWDQAAEGMEGDAGQMFGPIKAAVMAFSQSLAQTLAPQVRVNCVAPGWIQTAWGQQADPRWHRRAQQQSLLQRWGTPQDVAAMAIHMCSPSADFITGQVVNVNGGWNRKPG